MKDQMKILIGYDGSPCADAALDDLRRAGLPRNVETVILCVSELWLPELEPHESAASSDLARSIPVLSTSKSQKTVAATGTVPISGALSLARAAKARVTERFPTWVISAEESSGSPSREILKKAAEVKPDLIALGCQGRSALGGFLLGSVSQKVVNEARCTVRVSRGTAWKDGSPVRIVIGVDGSPGSDLAVSMVASRVWPTGSSVRLITAVDLFEGAGKVSPLKNNSSLSKSMKRELVDKIIKDASKRLRGASLSVSTRIEAGDPKRVLIAQAEEWGADSIFLGASAAANLIDRFLLGSVATAIVGRAHCSVEVVRNGY